MGWRDVLLLTVSYIYFAVYLFLYSFCHYDSFINDKVYLWTFCSEFNSTKWAALPISGVMCCTCQHLTADETHRRPLVAKQRVFVVWWPFAYSTVVETKRPGIVMKVLAVCILLSIYATVACKYFFIGNLSAGSCMESGEWWITHSALHGS